MKLEWSASAQADRRRIFDHIEQDNPAAAIAVDDRIKHLVENLILFPRSGRPGRVEGTRELVITGTPYIAAYRIAGDAIRILTILHGAQRWPHDLPVA